MLGRTGRGKREPMGNGACLRLFPLLSSSLIPLPALLLPDEGRPSSCALTDGVISDISPFPFFFPACKHDSLYLSLRHALTAFPFLRDCWVREKGRKRRETWRREGRAA